MSATFTYLRQPLHRYTFKAPKVKAWVEDHCKGLKVLNLFAGPTRLLGCIEFTNDTDLQFPATFHLDALDCVRALVDRGETFDAVVLDPPYSYRKSMELYNGNRNSRFKLVLDELPKILEKRGVVITFGYQSEVMCGCRGFALEELLIVYHGGAQHNTLAAVERSGNFTVTNVTKKLRREEKLQMRKRASQELNQNPSYVDTKVACEVSR